MDAKTIVVILVVMAVIVVAANVILYTPDEQQLGDACRELIYDADLQSWVEPNIPLDGTVNECDEKFQECYAKVGNVYAEMVECLNTP